jgi:hypothetical protein
MVESDPGASPAPTEGAVEATLDSVLADLRELIAAIDRRVPRLERRGEDRIVMEAAALRQRATERIAEIEAAAPTTP